VLILSSYRREMNEARARVSRSVLAHTSCGPIEYAQIGAGVPVFIVHGAGGGFDQGLDIGAPLAGRGFRVTAMSRFGYLRTPLPADASAAAQADAHAGLLDALSIPQVAMVGASAGAPSSLQFALRHPQRCSALVLIVPVTFAPRAHAGVPKAGAATELLLRTVLKSDFLLWAGIRYARPLLVRSLLATPPEDVEGATRQEQARIDAMLRHVLPISLRRRGLLNDVAVIAALERGDLEQIAVPTLVMCAADDLFGTLDGARYTAAQIADAQLVTYPSGGHLLVGHGDAVVAGIATFLAERARRV
jgi:pimeloyl-ACP methyl ester carboxylesterase